MPAVMAGDSLSLECKMVSSPVKPRVTWIPPENSDCNKINHNGENIKVTGVSRCHSGVWTCELEYDGRKTVAKTTVFIIGKTFVLLNSLSLPQCIYPFT